MSSVAARARRRPRSSSASGSVPSLVSHASRSVPSGSAYRVACRTTSWLESTHVDDAPDSRASSRFLSMIAANVVASHPASRRSKLNAWPSPSGEA